MSAIGADTKDFINNLREYLGHYIVTSALRNIVVFELDSRPHESLKRFAVQASVTAKQHVLKRPRVVPAVRWNKLTQDNAPAGVDSRIDEKNSYSYRIPLQDGPLDDGSASIFGQDTYMRIENA
jgi:hypothetical protein